MPGVKKNRVGHTVGEVVNATHKNPRNTLRRFGASTAVRRRKQKSINDERGDAIHVWPDRAIEVVG